MPNNRYVYIWPPGGTSILHKIDQHLRSSNYVYRHEPVDWYVLVQLDNESDASQLEHELINLLSEEDRRLVRFASSPNQKLTMFEMSLVQDLDLAYKRNCERLLIGLLREERYESWRQDIVELGSHEVYGHEYLFRGFNRNGDMIPPTELFEYANTRNVFYELDQTARVAALRSVPKKEKRRIFINFMPGRISDVGVYLSETLRVIDEQGIDPSQVVYEVVETERSSDMHDLLEIINFYRSAGFQIALDDYGSGFNSFDTIFAVKPDYIKLDKSLVWSGMRTQQALDFMSLITETCHKNDIEVIAEGIEDSMMAKALLEIGVDYGQGWNFGKPKAVKN